jgi:hypothetical protein
LAKFIVNTTGGFFHGREFLPDPPDDDEEDDAGDDLCDLCFSSGVNITRTTFCGKTIGIECGCDEANEDGKCGNPDCEECAAGEQEEKKG